MANLYIKEESNNKKVNHMNINELLSQIDNKNIEHQGYSITIFDLEEKFKDQDIIIQTNDLSIMNEQGASVRIVAKAIYFKNCTFKNIELCVPISIENFNCQDVNADNILIENQKLPQVWISGTFNSLKLQKSNIKYIRIESKNQTNLIDFKKSEVKNIEIRISNIKTIRFHALTNCDNLIVLANVKTGKNINSIIEYFSMDFCRNINNIYVSVLSTPLHINNFNINECRNIEELELDRISIDFANLHSRKIYNDLKVSFSNIRINKYLSMNNIDLGQSVFKNINLSKCLFNNSLISKSLFYECSIEYVPDIPLKKSNKFFWLCSHQRLKAL